MFSLILRSALVRDIGQLSRPSRFQSLYSEATLALSSAKTALVETQKANPSLD